MNGIIEFFLTWCVVMTAFIIGWRMRGEYEIDMSKIQKVKETRKKVKL